MSGRLARLLIGALLLSGCQHAAPPQPRQPLAETGRVTPSLDHEVYLATENSLRHYRAVKEGLQLVHSVPLPVEAPVALAVNQSGLVYWRDWEMMAFSRDLGMRRNGPVNFDRPYLQGFLCAYPKGFLTDQGSTLQVLGSDLKPRGRCALPGFVEHMVVQSEVAYILDPEGVTQFLLKLNVSDPDQPRIVEQVTLASGTTGKGSHWLDFVKRRWYVLLDGQLLVFDCDKIGQGPMERLPGIAPYQPGSSGAGFRIWKHTSNGPLWALGYDSQGLCVVSLQLTSGGLQVDSRLPLRGSEYPLQSAPFLERAGSRLYVSDGGALWVIDVAGPQPALVQTLSFRYGLTLATIEGSLAAESKNVVEGPGSFSHNRLLQHQRAVQAHNGANTQLREQLRPSQ